MNGDQFAAAAQLIRPAEGLRLKPYAHALGDITIGYGRNLTSVGISSGEADELLENDIITAYLELEKYTWFEGLTLPRQAALADMMFNLGAARFSGFVGMIEALKEDRYSDAAEAMLESNWHVQVGVRAERDAAIVRSGALLD